MTRDNAAKGKNSDIEILRAFAILYTVILHFKVLLPADSILLIPLVYLDLSVGVDLFLVISGYVITGSIIQSTTLHTASRRTLMLSFWIKRVFRLLPAAWTWIAIGTIAQLAVFETVDTSYTLRDILLDTLAALSNVMNIYIPWCVAKGGGPACLLENYLGHYWSLSLEEQFYIVFPFLFFFFTRKALAVFLISALLAQFMWHRPFLTYAWYLKTDALCWGILLALLSQTDYYRRQVPALLKHRYLASTIGLLLLFFLPLLAANIQGIGRDMKPYGVALVAMFCASIVWLASYDVDAFSVGKHYRRVMLYLGSRSYSLYLSHLIVFQATSDLVGQFAEEILRVVGPAGLNTVLITIAGTLTLLGAELSYSLVESRLRTKGRAVSTRLLSSSHGRTLI